MNCHLVGSARLPLVRIRGAHLLLLAPRNQATTILFYCCVFSVFILFKTCDATMKRRSGNATINMIEARPLPSRVLGLDILAALLEVSQWKLRSALPTICPPVKLCSSEAEMLPATCFQSKERWTSAKRCVANSHRKTGAPAPRPPRPLPSHHTPIHHYCCACPLAT